MGGAALSRVRQQVIELLSGHQPERGAGPAARLSGRAGREERRLLSQLLKRVTAMESRLSAIEHRVGTGPELDPLDEQIDQVRRHAPSAAARAGVHLVHRVLIK